jgi:7,8-dihydroneopterin aldolase/epimerase/oxygenase
MDTIFIRELRLEAWIGLYRHEKIAPQTIEIDLEIALPGEAVFASGRVQDTIDYGVAVERIRALLADERFGLVESLAERIARLVVDEFGSPRVKVSISKLGILRNARRVGVTIERTRAA